jgi:choline dehydrogenase-like flavoprotein
VALGQEQLRTKAVDRLVRKVQRVGVHGNFRELTFSAHQMGTCRMHRSRWKGVCRENGETFGTHRLFVCDASLFPTPSGRFGQKKEDKSKYM